jgi:MinD-like ATPase involved in chromosome partitioning or flagellar assembly
VVNSINLGTPLVKSDPRSKIGREIRRVAQVITAEEGQVEEAKPKRSWNFFLKRSSSEKK